MTMPDTTNDLDFSTLPDLPRPSSSAYKRTSWSPSRSPARSPSRLARGSYYDYGTVYKDLSPGTTLRVIKASLENATDLHLSEEKLVKSIDTASLDDKNFGLKCAESSKLVKAWVEELEEWPWDWGQGNSLEDPIFQAPARFQDGAAGSNALPDQRAEHFEDTMSSDLPQFELRLEEIRFDLRDLDMEEQKSFVRDHIQYTGDLPDDEGASKDTNLADGLTALVTMTVLQTLPYYSRLLTLIACWSARLTVYKQMPNLREQIEAVRESLGVAWSIITKDKTFLQSVGDEHSSMIARSKLTQEVLDSLKTDLSGVLSKLGKQLDDMLDMLRRNGDDLPHKWIDAVEFLEQDFHAWLSEAPRILVEQESQPDPASRPTSVIYRGADDALDQNGIKTHRVSLANHTLQNLVANHGTSADSETDVGRSSFETDNDRPTTTIYSPDQLLQVKETSANEDWSNGSFFRRDSSIDGTEAAEATKRVAEQPDTDLPAQHRDDAIEATSVAIAADFSQFNFSAHESEQDGQRGRPIVPHVREPSLSNQQAFLDLSNSEEETAGSGIGTAHTTSWDELDELIATRTFVKSASPSPSRPAESSIPVLPNSTLRTGLLKTERAASQQPSAEIDSPASADMQEPGEPTTVPKSSRIPVASPARPTHLAPGNVSPLFDDSSQSYPETTSRASSKAATPWDELDEMIATRQLVKPLPKESRLPRSVNPASLANGHEDDFVDDDEESQDMPENLQPESQSSMAQNEEPQESETGQFSSPIISPVSPLGSPGQVDIAEPVELKRPATTINLVDSTPTATPELKQSSWGADPSSTVVEATKEQSGSSTRLESSHISQQVQTPSESSHAAPNDPEDPADVPIPSIEPKPEPSADDSTHFEEQLADNSVDEYDEQDVSLEDTTPNGAGISLRIDTEDRTSSPLSDSASRSSTFDGDSALAALELNSPNSETPDYDASQQALPDIDDEEDAQGKYENVVKDLKVKKARRPHLQTYTNKDLGLDDQGKPLRVKYTHVRHISDADKMLEQKIDSILPTIPASIEFKKEAPRSPGQAILEQFKKRSAIRKGQAVPDLTLAPALQQSTKTSRAGFASEIKLYHLTSADRAEPIKLYVRLVGERAERVMVRVGGGWADLGEYLRDFAMHHARVASSTDAPARPASRMTSLSPHSKSSGNRLAPERRNFSMPTKISSPRNDSTIPAFSATGNRSASRLSTRAVSRQGSRATSRASPRPEDDSAPTLGMSGPRSNTGAATEMSEEQQRWVDTMLERAKEFKVADKGGPQLEELGKVNNTRRVYKVGDLNSPSTPER